MTLFLPRRSLFWILLGVGIEIFAYPRWSFFFVAYPVLALYLMAIERFQSWKEAMLAGFLITIVGGFGNTFDTYSADPRGDLRRQKIAQQGY